MSLWTWATAFMWLAITGAYIVIAAKWALAAALTFWALYALTRTAIRYDTRRRT